MQTKQKSRWWIDAGLFAGLITACFVNLTGVDLHQWIGILAGLTALYHLVTHMDWVKVVTQRFFGKTSAISRIYYLLDASLFGGFFVMVATGLAMSTWLNLDLGSYDAWRSVHIGATVATVATTLLKLVLHRNWIAQTARKIFAQPAAPAAPALPAAAGGMTRRAFLATMGTVSVASMLALGQSVKSLSDSVSGEKTLTEQINTAAAATTSASTTSGAAKTSNIASSSSTGCVLRCNKGCSFPGRCRRYTDSNGNGKCDLGECA